MRRNSWTTVKARSRAGFSQGRHKDAGPQVLAEILGQHLQEAVLADGETDGGQIRSAQLLRQAVVAPAARHRVLGPEPHGRHLEGGAGVIIQAPDQLGLEL